MTILISIPLLYQYGYTACMNRKARLYRVELYDNCPERQAGGARSRQCGTTVGFWNDVVETFEQSHQNYWIEIFDAITDKRLAGPLAPGEKISGKLFKEQHSQF